uniref:Uncharacterized protein n=1 Tax=Zosterops lateralis melanops TaxID=1220523 RepID=A0A8D2NUJ1_ZOSLA
ISKSMLSRCSHTNSHYKLLLSCVLVNRHLMIQSLPHVLTRRKKFHLDSKLQGQDFCFHSFNPNWLMPLLCIY